MLKHEMSQHEMLLLEHDLQYPLDMKFSCFNMGSDWSLTFDVLKYAFHVDHIKCSKNLYIKWPCNYTCNDTLFTVYLM